MFDYVMEQLAIEEKIFDVEPQEPATAVQLAVLAEEAKKACNFSLPDAYLYLLSLRNGFFLGSTYVCGTVANQVTSPEDDRTIPGFIEANNRLQKNFIDAQQFITFGGNGASHIVYNQLAEQYEIQDENLDFAIHSFDDFESMLTEAVKIEMGEAEELTPDA